MRCLSGGDLDQGAKEANQDRTRARLVCEDHGGWPCGMEASRYHEAQDLQREHDLGRGARLSQHTSPPAEKRARHIDRHGATPSAAAKSVYPPMCS